MQVILEVIKKKSNINRVTLKERTLIGRSSECHLKIASSQVSRKHCEIDIQDQKVTVRDLQSANGTQVDGVTIPVNKIVPLNPGAQLEIGNVTFLVQFKPAEELKESGSTVEIAAYRDIENLKELEQQANQGNLTAEDELLTDTVDAEDVGEVASAEIVPELNLGATTVEAVDNRTQPEQPEQEVEAEVIPEQVDTKPVAIVEPAEAPEVEPVEVDEPEAPHIDSEESLASEDSDTKNNQEEQTAEPESEAQPEHPPMAVKVADVAALPPDSIKVAQPVVQSKEKETPEPSEQKPAVEPSEQKPAVAISELEKTPVSDQQDDLQETALPDEEDDGVEEPMDIDAFEDSPQPEASMDEDFELAEHVPEIEAEEDAEMAEEDIMDFLSENDSQQDDSSSGTDLQNFLNQFGD